MATVAVFQPDPRVAARLNTALGPDHVVDHWTSWASFERRLQAAPPDACIIDGDHPSRPEALRRIRRVRRRHPATAIVALAGLGGSGASYAYGEAGVDGILDASAGVPLHQVRRVLRDALAAARANVVRRALVSRYGPDGAHAVAWAVEHAPANPRVSRFAEALGHSPRSLADMLRARRLPPPSRLLLWGRLLLAGAYLASDRRRVEDTAYELGYSTASALARAMRAETGLSPTEAAERGGMAAVMAALFPPGRGRGSGVRLATLGAALLLAAAGCATGGGRTPRVDASAIAARLDAPPLDQVHFGVLAVDARSGAVLFARNQRRKFVPASNQKILVTAAALSLLGPDYRYRTEVRAQAPPRDGTLEGDLVVVGSGDPTWSESFWGDGTEALRALADSVRAAGVRRVRGDLLVDVSAWDSSTVADTWEMADLPRRYAATGGAFVIDRGELRVVARGGDTAGAPVRVDVEPRPPSGYLETHLATAPADSSARVRASYLPESHRVVLTGRVPRASVDTLRFAQRDPVRLAARTLYRAFAEAGVEVEGALRVRWADDRAAAGSDCLVVASLASPPLADIVKAVLEPSQNWIAEQLVRTLGRERAGYGSWRDGLDVVRTFLQEQAGVDSLDVVLRDGSGLSAYNLVTPRAVVAVLRTMAAGPHAALYRDALAEPGEEESTLEHRLPGYRGRLWAKTGTITNVNSLSGYLVRNDGRPIVFSILSNGSGLPSRTVRAALDDVVRILAGDLP